MKKLMRKTLCSLLVVLMCFTSVAIGGFSASAKVYNGTTYITKSDLESGYIELGSYPQTLVTDETLIASLNKAGGSTSSWTSYGYYRGTGSYGTMQQSNYMCYLDMTYNNVKYRGVYFSEFRPTRTINSSGQFQSANGYPLGRICWFKYEPLKWRVLDKDTGLVMCESIIDSQAISNTVYERSVIIEIGEFTGSPIYSYYHHNDAAKTNLANDYATSSIRSWLNNDFYNTAFSSEDKTAIVKSNYSINGKSFSENIVLPGKGDIQRRNYGFNGDSTVEDPARVATGTDYAKCQGLKVNSSGNSSWRLRSVDIDGAYNDYGDYSSVITDNGDIYNKSIAWDTSYGIRPILSLSLHTHNYTYKEVITRYPNHLNLGEKRCICVCGVSRLSKIPKTTEHTFNTVVDSTPATCTQEGSITKSCACGATNTETVPTTPHNFNGSVCTTCGYNRANDCSCNCHKSGIAHFFFVIVNFFEKLFGNNKICACGAAH